MQSQKLKGFLQEYLRESESARQAQTSQLMKDFLQGTNKSRDILMVLTETTGDCYCLFPVKSLYSFSLSEAILLIAKEGIASKENNWSSFPSQRNSHECLKKKKKKAGILPGHLSPFLASALTAGTDGVWVRHLTS